MQRASQRSWAWHRLNRTAGLMLMALTSALAGLALAIAGAMPSPVKAQTIPGDAQATCTVPTSTFNSWWETGSPSLNGVVNPANSVTFPNAPNCSFYQWSKQMFLWLTSPAPLSYGGGGGRIFNSSAFFDVSPEDSSHQRTFIPHVPGRLSIFSLRAAQVGAHGLPVVMDKRGRMFEVEHPRMAASGKQLILNRAGKMVEIERATIGANGKAVFRDKAGRVIASPKPVIRTELRNERVVQKFVISGRQVFINPFGAVIDTEEGQADGGVLLAQNGSLVYYETMVNDVYAYFLTGTKDGGITPAPTQFPTTAADLAKITAFASAHGKTFPDPNALAVEVKSAWVEAAGLPNLSSYITVQATIPTFDKTSPNKWVPSGQKTTQLALLGMHVVGSTAGHPEMIWATFEHFGNAPNAAYTYNATTGTNPHTVPQNTAGAWVFSASGSAGPFNVMHQSYIDPNIVSTPSHTISPSDTMRFKPWGGAANASPNPLDPTVSASNTEIISIHNSVHSMMPAGDIRNNYFMTGATWTINGFAFNGNFGNPGNPGVANGKGVGTSQLSNTTMETYQQVNTSFDTFGNNCFSCHQSNSVSVSHVFNALKPLF